MITIFTIFFLHGFCMAEEITHTTYLSYNKYSSEMKFSFDLKSRCLEANNLCDLYIERRQERVETSEQILLSQVDKRYMINWLIDFLPTDMNIKLSPTEVYFYLTQETVLCRNCPLVLNIVMLPVAFIADIAKTPLALIYHAAFETAAAAKRIRIKKRLHKFSQDGGNFKTVKIRSFYRMAVTMANLIDRVNKHAIYR